jgi:Xaa-Pro aminopeptidase
VNLDAVVDVMAQADVDLMLLGREANARTIAGTTRLWLAGTRAFAPGCVVVRQPASVHVLANSDDAVPEGFPVDHLYGITWNPEKLLGALTAIPGVVTARRVAVDGMTPMMATMLEHAIPAAQLVDAAPILAELRDRPDTARVGGVRAAAEVARAGLAVMQAHLRAGAKPRTIRGACAEAFATFGVTTPAFDAVVSKVDARASTWISFEDPVTAHEPVLLRAGVLRDGWEASVGRTYVASADGGVEQAAPPAWDALVEACRAGARVGDLRAQGAIVYGLGFGVEPWDDGHVLTEGSTCALEVQGPQSVRQDALFLERDGARVLT